jgi:hypothetical protein
MNESSVTPTPAVAAGDSRRNNYGHSPDIAIRAGQRRLQWRHVSRETAGSVCSAPFTHGSPPTKHLRGRRLPMAWSARDLMHVDCPEGRATPRTAWRLSQQKARGLRLDPSLHAVFFGARRPRLITLAVSCASAQTVRVPSGAGCKDRS